MRAAARSVLERLGVMCALPQLGRRLNHGRALILAYHNVVPEGHRVGGERALHLHVAAFLRHVDSLGETHEILPLERILAGSSDHASRPTAAITFDDAYRGALKLAIPELTDRCIPSTVFVAPGTLGATSFWWDALASANSGCLDEATREYALETLGGEEQAIRDWARDGGNSIQSPDEWERPGTSEELEQVAVDPLVTLGSHSWSHPNLVCLKGGRLDEELHRPLEWLQAQFPARTVPLVAYPYGRTSPLVEAAARKAGYSAAFRVRGGLLSRSANAFSLPRLNVPAGVSPRGFELRAAGVLTR